MIIRTLEPSDAQAWWDLRLEGLETEPLAFGKSVEEHRQTPVETIAERFGGMNESYFTLGAFDRDALVGMVTFMRDTGVKDRHKGRIYGVYVSHAYRGLGLGQRLMTTLLERARKEASLEQILLAVATTQEAAKRLYRGAGFQIYGIEPRALKVGSTYVDEDLMILQIQK